MPTPVPAAEETRDLGFGSVVSRESGRRLLNRDGTFNVKRKGLGFWTSWSAYHAALTMTWVRFFAWLCGSYLVVNALFALGFVLGGPHSLRGAEASGGWSYFLHAFFFSVQTFSTIGYGNVAPGDLMANLLVTAESLVGLLWVAISTGLLFARFSRPTAKFLFSSRAVVGPYRDGTGLMFRLANARSSQVIELQATVLLARFVEEDGRRVRRFFPLQLERDKVVFFPLSWTIVHPIDASSPLRGVSEEELRAAEGELLVLLAGVEETFAQTVHARSSYRHDEIVWGAKFGSLFERDDGELTIDIGRLDEIEPAPGPAG